MNDTAEKKVGAKEKLAHELRRLALLFVYLASFFTVFRLYTKLVLAEYEINSFAYGLTLLKSLALAKIVLTGDALRLGAGPRTRPLIVTTVYCALVFSVFAFAFEILEHIALDWFRGRGPSEVFAELLEHGWPHLVAMTAVVFLAFLPFFAFRETARALGENKLRDLFLKRRAG
jgi:hypothetical protein